MGKAKRGKNSAGGAGGAGKSEQSNGTNPLPSSLGGLLVLFCGLPGSGKSTLAAEVKRFNSTGTRDDGSWALVSQDELGTQDACKREILRGLKHRKPVILDRCNVHPSERKMWLNFILHHRELQSDAKGGGGGGGNAGKGKGKGKGGKGKSTSGPASSASKKPRVACVFMDTPAETCKTRAKLREAHATLDPDKAEDVIDQFCRGLKRPEAREGFQQVYIVTPTTRALAPSADGAGAASSGSAPIAAALAAALREGFTTDDFRELAVVEGEEEEKEEAHDGDDPEGEA
jgi:predicted kinase